MIEEINSLGTDERSFIASNENYRIYNVDSLDKMYDKLHEHDFIEVFILLTGSVTYVVEQGVLQLKDFDIVLVPPHTLHKLSITKKDVPYKRIVLWIKKKYLKSISSEKTDLYHVIKEMSKDIHYIIRNPEFTLVIKPFFQKIISLQLEDLYGSDLLIENTIRELFLMLNQAIIKERRDATEAISNPIVLDVVKYIENNLSNPLTIKEISNALNFDSFYISHTFTEIVGTTIHKYIIKKRLNKAKNCLEEGMNIKDIIKVIGFNDESHFIQVFKKEFGSTPKQYQKRINNKHKK